MSGPIQGSGVRPALCQASCHVLMLARCVIERAVSANCSGYGSPISNILAGKLWAVTNVMIFAGLVCICDAARAIASESLDDNNSSKAGSRCQLEMQLMSIGGKQFFPAS